MVAPVTSDPDLHARWQALGAVAAQGLRGLRRWRPDDGLGFAAGAPAHQHTTPTLLLGLAGTVRVRGHRDVELAPGDALLIEPGCWHDHLAPLPGATALGLGFLAGRCELQLVEHPQPRWSCIVEQPYRRLVDDLLAADDGRPQLAELLTELLRAPPDFRTWIPAAVLPMADYLRHHLHEPLEAEEIIIQAGTGRTVAYDRFKEFFGRSPKQELLAQRLDLARHLLLRGCTVTEAARRTGFPNRAELTRAYRRRWGHPPTGVSDPSALAG